MTKTADQASKNWQAAMQAPLTAQKYKDGINNYTGNPMQKAAQNLALYLHNVTAAVQSGRMANALNSADPAMWKNNSVQYGAQKLGTGATKGAPKYLKAAQRLAPIWAQMRSASDGVGPRGGLAQAQAKSNAALAVLMQATGRA